ncbi:type II toxin-antitoxin system VapC family toxin [candidate division KSB1 bacterium]|nr:type II toxin-antitoxin system VapC family toxin [candidate division KSB1 bacterium]
MNLVDSSGWLEYFADGKNATIFTEPLQNVAELIVPTICLYEVFKVVLRERNEDDAIRAIALMHQGKIIELTSEIAIQAARHCVEHKIPMADSIVLTIAKMYNATLWTEDKDFRNIEGVKYFSK